MHFNLSANNLTEAPQTSRPQSSEVLQLKAAGLRVNLQGVSWMGDKTTKALKIWHQWPNWIVKMNENILNDRGNGK